MPEPPAYAYYEALLHEHLLEDVYELLLLHNDGNNSIHFDAKRVGAQLARSYGQYMPHVLSDTLSQVAPEHLSMCADTATISLYGIGDALTYMKSLFENNNHSLNQYHKHAVHDLVYHRLQSFVEQYETNELYGGPTHDSTAAAIAGTINDDEVLLN
ncbi:MAG: hypothetical protein H6765_09585 [Candidatus Peribacteria bacterium]|nr:MAG: hypothetical protein H6765_09585 [Candidatus Peribacteria bacterium]